MHDLIVLGGLRKAEFAEKSQKTPKCADSEAAESAILRLFDGHKGRGNESPAAGPTRLCVLVFDSGDSVRQATRRTPNT